MVFDLVNTNSIRTNSFVLILLQLYNERIGGGAVTEIVHFEIDYRPTSRKASGSRINRCLELVFFFVQPASSRV